MLNISDYVQDLQYPHMLSLALDYGTEIMVRQYEVGVLQLTFVEVVRHWWSKQYARMARPSSKLWWTS
jgi:hypothetical protein